MKQWHFQPTSRFGGTVELIHIKHLGSGGFGAVDLVRDPEGKTFARKTFSVATNLPPHMVENVRRRFIREAKTQSGIRHQNIVPVVYSQLEGDAPYYLMPVAVGSLQDEIDRDPTLGGNWLQAINDIAVGLDELHQMGIYHRDLKPQNVLRYEFEQNNQKYFYYAVSDFGLIAMNESRVSKLTVTGMAKGTDYYTAPEITSDLRRASPESDIYSLGCILHEMVGSGPRIPCHEIKDDGPFSAILLSCTRNDPQRRFKSVRAVLDAVMVAANEIQDSAGANQNLPFSVPLAAGETLEKATWQQLVDFVEDNQGTADANAVLMRLSLIQVQHVCTEFTALANRLGVAYAAWINEAMLDFARCDFVSNLMEEFIRHGSFETKVDGLMALLSMGTSHNRWYVENRFVSLCGPTMELSLAKRLAVEFRAAGPAVCRMIDHLERSIDTNRTRLHPILTQTLTEVCP